MTALMGTNVLLSIPVLDDVEHSLPNLDIYLSSHEFADYLHSYQGHCPGVYGYK